MGRIQAWKVSWPLLSHPLVQILDALEVVRREEKNKSLQQLFKELNDNTTNAFEFGKSFLAYLLSTNKKAGADLTK